MKPHLKPMMVSPAELVSLAKKKVLLRLLAKRELDRRGISVSVADAQRLADSVRRHFGLHTGAQLRAWLARVGLTEKTFSGLMLSWAAVSKAEAIFARQIDLQLAPQVALGTIRDQKGEATAA